MIIKKPGSNQIWPAERLKTIPTTTGVYLFFHKKESVYIGKSVNLRARIKSHLENARIDKKENVIVTLSDSIKVIITDSEFKALVLESQLISKYKPRYNVRWRDDKSYLYIKVNLKESYPRFQITRRENKPEFTYFGPFSSVRTATNLLREIRKVIPFCQQKNIGQRRCFYAKIGLCDPCPSLIEKIKNTQEKKHNQSIYRSNIRQAIKVLEGNTDLILRSLFKNLKKLTARQRFEEAIVVRNRIARLEGLLYRGRLIGDVLESYNNSDESLNQLYGLLAEHFSRFKKPIRIECYDVSNLDKKMATASMVVFTDGLVDKKEYRRFKIINKKLNSDTQMFEEVIARRLKNKWPKSDLMVIDGGKPQIRTVLKIMKEAKTVTPIIGIAKRPDRLIIGNENLPTIRPNFHHLGFNLIRAVRDESHRFARKYHLHLRQKKMI